MRRAVYHEYGGRWLVDVLSDVTEPDGGRRVRLKLVEVQRPSSLVRNPDPGDEWESWHAEGSAEAYCGWHLEDE